MCVCVCVCVRFYSVPLPQARCDASSLFQQSSIDMNSEFSFSTAGFCKKAKEPTLIYYLL